MNVRRLVILIAEKDEPITPDSQNCWYNILVSGSLL